MKKYMKGMVATRLRGLLCTVFNDCSDITSLAGRLAENLNTIFEFGFQLTASQVSTTPQMSEPQQVYCRQDDVVSGNNIRMLMHCYECM